jgi:hypothetical protein
MKKAVTETTSAALSKTVQDASQPVAPTTAQTGKRIELKPEVVNSGVATQLSNVEALKTGIEGAVNNRVDAMARETATVIGNSGSRFLDTIATELEVWGGDSIGVANFLREFTQSVKSN